MTICLNRNGEIIDYGKLWKVAKGKERKELPIETQAHIIVNELNDLLPNSCLKQGTMFYFVKE